MKIYIVNVGVNKSSEMRDGLMCPIFSDRKFEFIPIQEVWETSITKKYCDLKSFYSKNGNLSEFIPEHCWEEYIHCDPNFEYHLYGDVPTGRGSNLYNINVGDIILFIASLVQYNSGFDRSKRNFYLIGEIEVEKIWKFPNKLNEEDIPLLSNHAHIIREIGDNQNQKQIDSEFIAIKGTDKSKRYYRAVPMTKEVCDDFLRDKNGDHFNWFGHTNQVIGSYTRTTRAFFNLNTQEQNRRWDAFKEYIQDNCL